MPTTLRAAAALLAAARAPHQLLPVVAALGFTRPPLTLDAEGRAALGLPAGCGSAAVVEGAGALRALVLATPADGRPLRDHIARAAARVAARSPHLLWLVVAVDAPGVHVALAAWAGDRHPPRVAALVAERARVVDSDPETLAALAAAADAATADVLVHARWLDILGRDALGRRFYRALERVVGALADGAAGGAGAADRHDIALLYVSRLLFLAFLEAKGWLAADREYLARGYARCIAAGGAYHRRVLLPLFFGTLNTPRARRTPAARALGDVPFLNGGLFARSPLERRARALRFTDASLGAVFDELLGRYRFTAREDGRGWSEAAVDPEMLGRAFESLMAARERRTTGAFYTPQPLVERAAAAALASALGRGGAPCDESAAAAALRGELLGGAARDALRARLAALRVLDPACGSGAFLVHVLEQIAALAGRLGDARPVADVRREVLTRSIFGVDVNPTAVWLCELRLWLSVVIESEEPRPAAVRPLPNLDHHVRAGDALAGGGFDAALGAGPRAAGHPVARLRARYARATGARKRSLAAALDQAEREAALACLDRRIAALVHRRGELVRAARARDLFGERPGLARDEAAQLAALRRELRDARAHRRATAGGAALPFTFAVHFADAAASGFDLVIGNPPWVRLHNIARDARERLRAEYAVYRDAGWAAGADAAQAGRGFAAQVDLAALFVERGVQLLAPGGTLALLLPAKLWRSLAGGGVRRLLAAQTELTAIDDFSEAPAAFDASVYPSLLVARRRAATPPRHTMKPPDEPAVQATLHRPRSTLRWLLPATGLPLADPASPWLVVPPEVRSAFDRVARAGVPLGASPLGRPTLGVKCGCNDAFVVTVAAPDDAGPAGAADGHLTGAPPADLWTGEPAAATVAVCARARDGVVERALLRPLVRGEQVRAWQVRPSSERLLWTHDPAGRPLRALPPHAERWLASARGRLVRRADLRAGAAWWSLFRTEGAAAHRARVVWPDIGRAPRAAVLAPGDPSVPLNSCYLVSCRSTADAHALAALLNSPLAAAWLNLLAEPARGGYHRYLGWTTALLPVPHDWARALASLVPLGERAARGDPPAPAELTGAALDAFGLRAAAVAPLLAWDAR